MVKLLGLGLGLGGGDIAVASKGGLAECRRKGAILFYEQKRKYLQDRATRARASVEKPEHLSSLSERSKGPLPRTRRARSASVTTMRRRWRAVRHSKERAMSAIQGAA